MIKYVSLSTSCDFTVLKFLDFTTAETNSSGKGCANFEDADSSVTVEFDRPTISLLQLSRRHRLASLTLSVLVEFWKMAAEKSEVAAKQSKTDLLIPPFWLIYHLAGHPCVKFREWVISA